MSIVGLLLADNHASKDRVVFRVRKLGLALVPGVLMLLALSPVVTADYEAYVNGATDTSLSIVWHGWTPHADDRVLGYTTFKYRIMYSTDPAFGTVAGAYDSYATWFARWTLETGCQLYQVDPYSSTITYLSPSTTYYVKIHAYIAQAYQDDGACEPPYFNPNDGTAQLMYTYTVFSGTTSASSPPPPPGGGGKGCNPCPE